MLRSLNSKDRAWQFSMQFSLQFQRDLPHCPCTSRSSAHASAGCPHDLTRCIPSSCMRATVTPRASVLFSAANVLFHETPANQGQTLTEHLLAARPGDQALLLDQANSSGGASELRQSDQQRRAALRGSAAAANKRPACAP